MYLNTLYCFLYSLYVLFSVRYFIYYLLKILNFIYHLWNVLIIKVIIGAFLQTFIWDYSER